MKSTQKTNYDNVIISKDSLSMKQQSLKDKLYGKNVEQRPPIKEYKPLTYTIDKPSEKRANGLAVPNKNPT